MDSPESSVTDRQEDEVQALQAIYGEDVTVVRKSVSVHSDDHFHVVWIVHIPLTAQ